MIVPNPTPSPEQVMKALLDGNKELFVVDNIISSAKAFIHFTNMAEFDNDWKYALYELEKRFTLYSRIWEAANQNGSKPE